MRWSWGGIDRCRSSMGLEAALLSIAALATAFTAALALATTFTAAFASALGSTDLPDPEAAEDLLATRDDELPREYEPKDFERREVGMPIIPSPCHQRVTAPLLLTDD